MKPENPNKNINLAPTPDSPAQAVAELKDGIIAAANLPDMTKEGINRLVGQIIDKLDSMDDSRESLIAEMRAIQSGSGLYHNVGTNPQKVKAHSQIIEATKAAIQNKLNTPTIATETNINQFVDKTQTPQYASIKQVIMTGLKDAYQIGLDANGKLVGFDQETCSPMSIVFKGTQMILTPNGEGIEDTSALKRFIVSDVFNKLAKQQKLDLSELKNIEQSTKNPTPNSWALTQPTLKAHSSGPAAPLDSTPTPSLPAPLTATTVPLPHPTPTVKTLPVQQPQIKPVDQTPAKLHASAPTLKQTSTKEDPIQKPNPQAKPDNYISDPNRLKKDKLKALNWSKFTDIKVFPDNKVMLVGIDKTGKKSVQIVSSSNDLLIKDFKILSIRQLKANIKSKPELGELLEDNEVINLISVPEFTDTKLEEIPTSKMFEEYLAYTSTYLAYTSTYLADPNPLLNREGNEIEYSRIGDEIHDNFYSPNLENNIQGKDISAKKTEYLNNLASSNAEAIFDKKHTKKSGNWQFATFNNCERLSSEKTGRIYFNIEPMQAPMLYNVIVQRLIDSNLTAQFKIPSNYDDRPDCGVLYFDEAQKSLIQQILKDVVSSNKFTFRDELGKGQHPIGKGIGFAQEPSIPIINGAAFAYNSEGQISFGEKISWIMGVVLSNIKSQNLDQVKDKDMINQMYTTLMKKHGIDPNNPAFYNEDSKFESFKTFKV